MLSRSSLNRGFYHPEQPVREEDALVVRNREGALEQYGNTSTFNLENVLRQNILTSSYYKQSALPIDNWADLVDEIYYSVDHVEPWMSGNARGSSTAFNLLYRLGQLRPSGKEIRLMLDHKDSPYIRAVGFLYLRYTCNPRSIWEWFSSYLDDDEEFTPSPAGFGKAVAVGVFVRDILLDQYYFETIFPRIPVKIADEIEDRLRSRGLPTRALGNAGQGGEDRRGVTESAARPASVKQSLSVALGQRAPNRAQVRELGRGTGADLQLERTVKRAEERRRSRSPAAGRASRGSSPPGRAQREGPPSDARHDSRRDARYDSRYDSRYDRDRRYDARRRDDPYDARRREGDRRDRSPDRYDRRRDERGEYARRDRDRSWERRPPRDQRARSDNDGAPAAAPSRAAADVFRERPASAASRY